MCVGVCVRTGEQVVEVEVEGEVEGASHAWVRTGVVVVRICWAFAAGSRCAVVRSSVGSQDSLVASWGGGGCRGQGLLSSLFLPSRQGREEGDQH